IGCGPVFRDGYQQVFQVLQPSLKVENLLVPARRRGVHAASRLGGLARISRHRPSGASQFISESKKTLGWFVSDLNAGWPRLAPKLIHIQSGGLYLDKS